VLGVSNNLLLAGGAGVKLGSKTSSSHWTEMWGTLGQVGWGGGGLNSYWLELKRKTFTSLVLRPLGLGLLGSSTTIKAGLEQLGLETFLDILLGTEKFSLSSSGPSKGEEEAFFRSSSRLGLLDLFLFNLLAMGASNLKRALWMLGIGDADLSIMI
jgi:hypothetical protein